MDLTEVVCEGLDRIHVIEDGDPVALNPFVRQDSCD